LDLKEGRSSTSTSSWRRHGTTARREPVHSRLRVVSARCAAENGLGDRFLSALPLVDDEKLRFQIATFKHLIDVISLLSATRSAFRRKRSLHF
jgi:hypothetical protein